MTVSDFMLTYVPEMSAYDVYDCAAGHTCANNWCLVSRTPTSRGFYSKFGDNNATPCEPGYHCPVDGMSLPIQCEGGNFCSGSDAPATQTPIGTYAPSRSSAPTACEEGFTCPEPGMSKPTLCPAGYTCADRLVKPLIVPAGRYAREGSIASSVCEKGFFCPTAGTKLPIVCPRHHVCSPGCIVPVKIPVEFPPPPRAFTPWFIGADGTCALPPLHHVLAPEECEVLYWELPVLESVGLGFGSLLLVTVLLKAVHLLTWLVRVVCGSVLLACTTVITTPINFMLKRIEERTIRLEWKAWCAEQREIEEQRYACPECDGHLARDACSERHGRPAPPPAPTPLTQAEIEAAAARRHARWLSCVQYVDTLRTKIAREKAEKEAEERHLRAQRERDRRDRENRQPLVPEEYFIPTDATSLQVLGLLPNASRPQINKRFRALVVKYHPDKQAGRYGGDARIPAGRKEECEAFFKRVSEARDKLLG